MEQQRYHESIIDYYEKAEISYRDVWDLNHSMAFHCGFWDGEVKSIRQALLRQNQLMGEWVALTPNDELLDAGCGIGGSAIYVSKHFGCKSTGISIVPYQIEQASQKAIEHKVNHLANFTVADYCVMPFDDASFTVVWAIESVCYALDKKAFLAEAFRVLKPGGRLIVADGFRCKTNLSTTEEQIMKQWEDGYAVHELAHHSVFKSQIAEVGFERMIIKEANELVMPSAKRLYYFGLAAKYYRKLLKLVGKKYGNDITIKNTEAAISQYLGIKKGLWTYDVFIAQKPFSDQ